MKVLALLLSLSLLVMTHELGHLGFAKLFHTRVRRFYIFFNPKFSIFKAKKFEGKWHFLFFNTELPESWMVKTDEPRYRTEKDSKGRDIQVEQWEEKEPDNTLWGIGWVPLGGYCDIAGMIDETKSSKDLASEPQPWEYRSKKAWQRLCIISGGVLVNFLSALLIYTCIFAHWGKDELPLRNADLGYEYHQILLDEGLQNGDIIWSIDGVEQNNLAEVQQHILLDKPQSLVVKRRVFLMDYLLTNNDTTTDMQADNLVWDDEFDTIHLSQDLINKIMAENPKQLMAVRMPFVVSEFGIGSLAKEAGMQKDDRVVSFNGEVCQTYAEIAGALAEHKGEFVTLGVMRNNEYQEVGIQLNDEGKIGVQLKTPLEVFKVEHTDYSFIQAIPAGISYGWETLVTYVSSLKLVFTKQGAKSLGGFGTLGSLFPETWDWFRFWNITAFLAIILAFMNIIPIPGLDGGHILFTLWEMVTRRKPSEKFLEVAQTVGMVLLLGLLVLANGNDLFRWISTFFR